LPNFVELRRDGDIAIIEVDNPPVNALRREVREGLTSLIAQARDDATVKAVVLTCAGRTFIAGADITEFDKPPPPPQSVDMTGTLDSTSKPVVAALHGTALGGGLEVALACHYRVAAPGTRVGLPEIKLGIIPGGGGTLRLPRLIGVDKALRMILNGDPIDVAQAKRDGVVDEIIEGNLTAGAVAFARRVLAENRPLRRVRDMDDKLAAMRADPKAFDTLVAELSRRSRGLHAPAAAIEAMRWTLDLPFDQALAQVRQNFGRLRDGDQAKAQRYIFFAEREAVKLPDVPAGTKPREIGRAAVIGAGTMGGGIAMCFANGGIPVTVVETGEEPLRRGLDTIAKNYRNTAARGGLTSDDVERRLALIKGTTDLSAVSDADFVVEAVFEDMDIKKKVFRDLDRLTQPSTILASNTSYLDVNVIGASTSRPQDVLGTHFFSPANVMRLLEIVRGKATAPDVLATAISVGRKLGKVPAVVGVCHGFVGNRMLRARAIEAERMLLEGALPHEVDAAITEFGFPMGPFAMGDLAGLDVSWRMRKAQGMRAEIADTLCEMGRYGQKTGRGFYRYEGGSRSPIPDPEVEQIIAAASVRLDVRRRAFERAEILERLLYPMINEGARVLEEGIATRPGDIDVIYVYGYGFPVWRGGPMYHADRIGLAVIRDRLKELAAQTGDARHQPAALLARLADEGRGFASLTPPKSSRS
jgi:3-hydroxyacyl-CoA dehydrogenase